MNYPSIMESAFFYSAFLPKIKTKRQKQKALKLINEYKATSTALIIMMEEESIFFPRYFQHLKHSVKMLEIYEIDILDLDI